MSKRKLLAMALLCGLALVVAGCNSTPPALPAGGRGATSTATPTLTATPAPVSPTFVATPTAPVTPTALAPTAAGALGATLSGECNLLDSQELSHFYSTAEVVRAVPQMGPVSHPAFSTAKLAAAEVSCTFYVFHRPGHSDEQMLQVNYWVDVPLAADADAWAQAWAQAKSGKAQAVPGLGADAFYANGRLTFKQSGVYVTVEALNQDTSAGNDQQINLEKQVALDALGRLG
jgi:hypothetical protein